MKELRMKQSMTVVAGCVISLLVWGGGTAQAAGLSSAQEAAAAPSGARAHKRSSKTHKSDAAPRSVATAKFLRGSEETPGERSTRLKRECKGGVNAGACAGYTR